MSDKKFLNLFFHEYLLFFTREVPKVENDFKSGYDYIVSLWWGMRRNNELGFLKPNLLAKLDQLFEEAEAYFYRLVGSDDSYSTAIKQDSLKSKWSEVQKIATSVLKEMPHFDR